MKKYGILGSASTARAAVMSKLGLVFDVLPTCLDESTVISTADISKRALCIAQAKMERLKVMVSAEVAYLVCADTCVLFKGNCLGKPKSLDEAKEWLMAYAGQSIEVITGLILFSKNPEPKMSQRLVKTKLTFANYTYKDLEFYFKLNVPWQVAGGLSWQDNAEFLVREIKGSSSNIIGLPIFEFYVMLKEHGLI